MEEEEEEIEERKKGGKREKGIMIILLFFTMRTYFAKHFTKIASTYAGSIVACEVTVKRV